MAKRPKREWKRSDLTSKTGRKTLPHHAKPYFADLEGLARGCALGYRTSARRTKTKRPGKWLARYYEREDKDYSYEPIGLADDIDKADGVTVLNFDQAQEIVREKWRARQLVKKGVEDPRKPYTIDQCAADYFEYLRKAQRDVENARRIFEVHVLPRFGGRRLADIAADEWERWLDRLLETPPRVRTKAGAKQQYKDEDASDPEVWRRRRSRVRRIWATVRAACNRARKRVPSAPWADVELGDLFKDVDKARETSLKQDGAQRLLNAAGDERDLLHAALVTGARLGELVALNVRDYDPDNQTIYIRKSKTGKARHVILAEDGAELFDRLTAGRAPDDIMLPAPDGSRWAKVRVQYRLAKTCERAKVGHVNFHALRHVYCTLAIEGGAPLHVVAANTGHSVAILTKHYSHLSDKYRREQIRAALPRFEAPKSNVERFKAG
jgi:integrase